MTPEVKTLLLAEFDNIISGAKEVKDVPAHAAIAALRELDYLKMKVEANISLTDEERYSLKRVFIVAADTMEANLKMITALLKVAETLEGMGPIEDPEMLEKKRAAYANRDAIAGNIERYKTIILAI